MLYRNKSLKLIFLASSKAKLAINNKRNFRTCEIRASVSYVKLSVG